MRFSDSGAFIKIMKKYMSKLEYQAIKIEKNLKCSVVARDFQSIAAGAVFSQTRTFLATKV